MYLIDSPSANVVGRRCGTMLGYDYFKRLCN